MKFRSEEHRTFFFEMMEKVGQNDSYHRAFFYIMGICADTRTHIDKLFNFEKDCIVPEGMHGGWITSGSLRVCCLAFNLWSGFNDEESGGVFTPFDLFCCEFAPYFLEGIKVKYPEYCKE